MKIILSARAGICFAVLATSCGCASSNLLKSPSTNIVAKVSVDKTARLVYSVRLNGKAVIGTSPLGITVQHSDLGRGVKILSVEHGSFSEKYSLRGNHDSALNSYKQAIYYLENTGEHKRYKLEVRAFNDGIAYRYIVPVKGSAVVNGEASAWNIPEGSRTWYQENVFYYEGLYYSAMIDSLGKKRIGPPVTYRTPNGVYATITEAALLNYSGMSLESDTTGLLHAAFINDQEGWALKDSIVTPWRVTLASEDLNGLVNADIINSLNPPPDSSLTHAAWIRPGRGTWSYFMHDNVTTVDVEKSYAANAAKLGFEYNIVDAGWESSWPEKWKTLRELVAFSRELGVETWVWKSYNDLKETSTRRAFFDSLQSAGVVGVKIDFIDKEGFDQVLFYEQALRDAAAHRLMIDFHGANKPTGTARTYPNELTREAIYGQEWRTYTPQGATNNVTLPFTRFLAGPGDYTPGVFNSAKSYGTSWSHQLALPAIFFSPLACWPEDPAVYLSSAAVHIIKTMPTVWDETLVLPGSAIGKLAAFARRKGNDWYIAISNGDDDNRFSVPLSFLPAGDFRAQTFSDDLGKADTLLPATTGVSGNDSLWVIMRPKGGFVAKLVKTPGPVSKLTIRPGGAVLVQRAVVSMSTNEAEGEIRYTTDGSVPTERSSVYTQPLLINNATRINAQLYKNGTISASAVAQFVLSPAPLASRTGGIFIDSQLVTLSGRLPTDKIYYTLDGSDPTTASYHYQQPIVLRNSATVKARIFYSNEIRSELACNHFEKMRVHPAINSHSVQDTAFDTGLQYRYYTGEWEKMPSFKPDSAVKTGRISSVDLKGVSPNETNYGIEYEGFIDLPADAVYEFSTVSDDGSALFVDAEKVVDNDGLHGELEKSGEIALAKGKHFFKVTYFQGSSGASLKAFISGAGLKKQEIQAAMFTHHPRS